MDISKLAPVERTVEILHPKTKAELGIKVSLVSADHPSLKAIRRKITDRGNYWKQRGKEMPASELEALDNEFVFTAMTGWDWYGEATDADGVKPNFSREKVYSIFERLPWFKAQISEEMQETESFIPA